MKEFYCLPHVKRHKYFQNSCLLAYDLQLLNVDKITNYTGVTDDTFSS